MRLQLPVEAKVVMRLGLMHDLDSVGDPWAHANLSRRLPTRAPTDPLVIAAGCADPSSGPPIDIGPG
jgi:hypothetical protein